MAWFNFGKKKEEKKAPSCCCQAPAEEASCCCQAAQCCCSESISSIKVLGAGCKSCHEQLTNVQKAIENAGLSVEAEYVTDMERIMEYGVMTMPAIVINEKVVAAGKVLSTKEVEKLLK